VGLEGLPGKVFILQMSGPIAVGMAAFGVQFDVAPRFLASAVCLTSLLSVISVSAILYFLMVT
jgi:predicted permease